MARRFLLMVTMLGCAAVCRAQGVDATRLRWARSVSVAEAPASADAVACAVLDPATFHGAAPVLRDLRLMAGEREVPYAMEESYDTASLESGVTTTGDRSFYDAAVRAPMVNGVAEMLLPARVPVERIVLQGEVKGRTEIRAEATIVGDGATEQVSGFVMPGDAVLPVTLGANLQQDARVRVHVNPATSGEVVLEMRRRWICFAPVARAMTLYFGDVTGGDAAMHAPEYAYPKTFHMPVKPVEAELGAVVANPQFAQQSHASRRRTLLLMLAGLAAVVGAVMLALVSRMVGREVARAQKR